MSFVLRLATPALATKDSVVQILRARIEGAPLATSQAAAMECWKTQSTVQPLRDDGQPNRPLTAYNVVIEKVSS